MQKLRNKTALVTGASQGIGEAIARLFAAEGAKVVIADVKDTGGERVVETLRTAGGDAMYVHLDVSRFSDWSAATTLVYSHYGSIDILVNNAGIGSHGSITNETVENWQRVVEINQTGVWLGMKSTIPLMQAGKGGSIVNVCSVMGVAGDIGHFSYQATKGAIRMMSKNAALTYVADGIRCNTVCPGMIATEMAGDEDDGTAADFLRDTPMHRYGTPVEVANAVLFLASDDASFITGTDLVVDGGYLAR